MSSSVWTPPGVAGPAAGIRQHFWHRQECIDKIVERSLAPKPGEKFTFIDREEVKIVDVGAGYDPWAQADTVVDYVPCKTRLGVKHHTVDIDFEPLPFADQSVDFLYSRHTLEDIGNPLFVCREINRVAKRGYIEVPSPLQEFCRGVDAGKPLWRGHHHHRHFIWHEGNTLFLLPKYPIVEPMRLEWVDETELQFLLNTNPIAWNEYFWFDGPFEVKLLRHDLDFGIRGDYAKWIYRAMKTSFDSALILGAKHGLKPSDFVANA